MTPIYIFEDDRLAQLYPLTYARPAFDLRCGAGTLLDRMDRYLPRPPTGVLVREALADRVSREIRFPVNPRIDPVHGAIFINARWLMTAPPPEFKPDTAGLSNGSFAWLHVSGEKLAGMDISRMTPSAFNALGAALGAVAAEAVLIDHPWDLIVHQHEILLADFVVRGPAIRSEPMPGAHILHPQNVFISSDVRIFPGVVLDAQSGPIMIDHGTQIQPNAVITGPVYIGPDCIIRPGANIRADTSLGPSCRVGGEVIGSIFLANTNKQHEGFVGQSLIGQWANLGAGTTTSNLKNTYGMVRMPINGGELETGLRFLGSVIGDHAKIGIGACLKTGSVIGFASHIITSRPPKFVPSFAWVGEKGIEPLDFHKALAIAKAATWRREGAFTPADELIFAHIQQHSRKVEKFHWPQSPPGT
ncbi:MAG: hypothetical protein M1588_00680 [Planctomycetes bacterium]|jgi:UDP-N-acetylglucosamine diphosphorylase/glucosamine-1-phosphate N-acetyltransferase|nr:hypothetical protein [Planctomycetota bacterium]